MSLEESIKMVSDLRNVLNDMGVPLQRIKKFNETELLWLLRNLKINYGGHLGFKRSIEIIKTLLSFRRH